MHTPIFIVMACLRLRDDGGSSAPCASTSGNTAALQRELVESRQLDYPRLHPLLSSAVGLWFSEAGWDGLVGGCGGGQCPLHRFLHATGVAQLVREFTNEWSPRHQRALSFRDIK